VHYLNQAAKSIFWKTQSFTRWQAGQQLSRLNVQMTGVRIRASGFRQPVSGQCLEADYPFVGAGAQEREGLGDGTIRATRS
jgi:hypothetical protein